VRRGRWVLAAAAVGVAAAATGGVAASAANEAAPAEEPPANTATVQQGKLSAVVSQAGTLTYRARPDGSPYAVTNQASGVFTQLPDVGAEVGCGGVLYRVDDAPVLLLCGTVPAYRDLHRGDVGQDVRQLNRNLHVLGYDARARVGIDPGDDAFTWRTGVALRRLQQDKGVRVTGALAIGEAVFLPEPVRIAAVTGGLGAPARPGAPVLNATSGMLHVRVDLDPSDQGGVERGDPAQITLPGNTTVTGKVDGFGRVVQVPADKNGNVADATLPAWISLDEPRKAGGLDQALVRVEITTGGVENALSVPVTALVGKSGGGLAVEVAQAGGRRELVVVRVGLFDTAAGRVQVEGDLRAGDRVVVPSS
jgi:multidrug efflux pump subunit AcrA (membrane-fusion protein)